MTAPIVQSKLDWQGQEPLGSTMNEYSACLRREFGRRGKSEMVWSQTQHL
jgi:hypothetical protein